MAAGAASVGQVDDARANLIEKKILQESINYSKIKTKEHGKGQG